MRRRLRELGVEEANVSREGDRIVVLLPDTRVDFELVKRPGRLEFFDLQGDLVDDVSLDADGFPRPSQKPLKARPNTVVVTCGPSVSYCPGLDEEPTRKYYYLFKHDPKNKAHPVPELTGDDLEHANQDFSTATNEPVVAMTFTKEGARKFEEITRTLAERGRVQYNQRGGDPLTYFQQFAIVLDRDLKTAPTIDFQDNPAGIPGDGGAIITGVSLREAKDLALLLRTGSLPFELRIVSKENREK